MKALIAGGGIGGLATAIALRKAGVGVEVLERSQEVRESGAGLMIWPNGTRALQALGVAVRRLVVERISLRSWRGHELMEIPMVIISERYGSDVTFVSRADLQAALTSKLSEGALTLGADVHSFEETEDHVEVRLQQGSVAGDLLVGADGIRSVVRRELLRDGDPFYLGSTIWRGVVHSAGIPIDRGQGINWVGPGSEFLAFHLPDDRIYWAAVTKEPRGEMSGPGGHKQDLLDRFGRWQDPVSALIAANDDAAILRNDMYDRPPVDHWSLGRVTLVGDAAHPMTPNQGQGACQALEDAVALGMGFANAATVADAFKFYERRRLVRANRVVKASRQATRGVQIDAPILCAMRDTAARFLPRALMLKMLDRTLSAAPADELD
jgi:2-polyprenyl-6-methoxyphenol hydroxylase-like FAD-dependent oxidoreductase